MRREGGRDTIMELKLAQDFASVDQDLILLVFLDLRNVYSNIYRGRLSQPLEGYDAGPKYRDY